MTFPVTAIAIAGSSVVVAILAGAFVRGIYHGLTEPKMDQSDNDSDSSTSCYNPEDNPCQQALAIAFAVINLSYKAGKFLGAKIAQKKEEASPFYQSHCSSTSGSTNTSSCSYD